MREPVKRLLGQDMEGPLGTGLDAQLEGQPDGPDRLDVPGHGVLAFLGGPLEREQADRAGVRQRLDPPFVPLAQGHRIDVVDAISPAAFGDDQAGLGRVERRSWTR
jgi:hypothetical protein